MIFQKPSQTKIHLKALKTTLFQILFYASFTMLTNIFGYAQDLSIKENTVRVDPKKSNIDSLQSSTIKNNNPAMKPAPVVADSIVNDSISKPKGSIWLFSTLKGS